MSILEGIGFNIPIVTTPVGGIPQIVQDKKMVSSAIQGMHKNSPMQLSRYFPMRTSLIIWCQKIEKSQKDIQ